MSSVWKCLKLESESSLAAVLCGGVTKELHSDMTENITEKVTELIALDNQLISVEEDQGFLHHLEFLNPWYALGSQHYFILAPLKS